MNHWEILIIPLIAVGAWILSTIFKPEEGNKSKGPQRRLDGARPARRPAPVLDKFLDDAGRRRDMPEGMESRKEPVKPASPPRRAAPPVPRALGQRRAAPILATIIDEPARSVVRRSAEVEKTPESLAVPLPIPLPPGSLASTAPPPPKQERPVSPILQEVARLLRSPKTAGVAFVMREILDRPLALRRPR